MTKFVFCFSAVAFLLCLHVPAAVALVGVPTEVDIRFDYDVVFSPRPLSEEDMLRIHPENLYPMRQANGSSFLCVLPASEEEIIASGMNEYRASLGSDSPGHSFQPGDVLPQSVTGPIHDAIATRGVLVSRSGYWTYLLSLGEFVRQEHEYQEHETDSKTGAIVVKTYTTERFFMGVDIHNWARTHLSGLDDPASIQLREGKTTYTLQQDHEGPYLSSLYPKGDVCDVTGGQRQAEVQLRCLERAPLGNTVVVDVQEVGTCAYIVKLYDRLACVQGLLERRASHLSVVCHPVPGIVSGPARDRDGDL